MSYLTGKKYSQKKEYSVIYSNFKGVDFSESDSAVSRERFAYLENMYRDYDGNGGDVIESIPGFRRVYDTFKKVNGLYTYKNSNGEDILVIHSETLLFRIPLSEIDNISSVQVTDGVADEESNCFCSGDSLFVLDGSNMFMLSDSYDGRVDLSTEKIYIPTTHINGTEYEQRNLLTRYFYEKYNVSLADSLSYGTPTLKYQITDDEKKECSVYGISDNRSVVYIPSRVKIGDTFYSVKSIDNHAFAKNTTLTECYVANGISTIGANAFNECLSLKKVVLSDSVEILSNSCFMDCAALSELHLGAGVKKLGYSAFIGVYSLKKITYALSSEQLQKIENANMLNSFEIVYNTQINNIAIGLEIHNPATEIHEVTDGESSLEYTVVKKGNICTEICVFLNDKNDYNGKSIRIKGRLSDRRSDYSDKHAGFVASNHNDTDNVSGIITKCRIAESFDGRIFLTGNPDYPGYCFYSALDLSGENHPLYFGEMNYFKDGVGNYANIALLAAGESLAVFKERDDGGGSIYYHTPKETNINILPKIYPTTYVHSGFVAKGRAISFFDDPVFISSKGLSALAKKNINLERSIATRSTNVNRRLLSENLKDIKVAVWQGYLVLLAEGRIYLADSRSTFVGKGGDLEYEWYYLSGIGGFRGDSKVYKYSSSAHSGFHVHSKTDEATSETILSTVINGETIYYTNENNNRYEVYPTEELDGGVFSAGKHLLSIDDKLIFATGDGQLLVFNTDKRGVAPPHISKNAGFDNIEYQNLWGSSIHPFYYSFAGHRTRYAIQTKRDDGSIPHLLKSTVKNSLTIKCKAVSSGKIICEVGTDNGGYKELTHFPSKDLFFEDIDFSSFSLSTDNVYTIPIHEKEKGWVEKQIALYSDEFASPFAVCIIAYRFCVKGKIKRNR